MERRQDSLVPSVLSAGTDPAHIPGLDEPAAGRPEQEPEGKPDAPAAEEATGTVTHDEASPGEAGHAEGDATAADATDTAAKEPAADDAAPKEGPSFEASDRRGAILADGSGVTFRLDDTEALIGWDEIGAVEVSSAKFGRRFSVVVHTTKHRTFDGDVEAPSRRDVRAWTEEFDAVLDAWFDDGGAADEGAEETTAAADEDTEDQVSADKNVAATEKAAE